HLDRLVFWQALIQVQPSRPARADQQVAGGQPAGRDDLDAVLRGGQQPAQCSVQRGVRQFEVAGSIRSSRLSSNTTLRPPGTSSSRARISCAGVCSGSRYNSCNRSATSSGSNRVKSVNRLGKLTGWMPAGLRYTIASTGSSPPSSGSCPASSAFS